MSLYPSSTTFMAKVGTEGFQCIQMMTDQPWTFQVRFCKVTREKELEKERRRKREISFLENIVELATKEKWFKKKIIDIKKWLIGFLASHPQTCQLLRFGRSLLRPSDRCYGRYQKATVTYKFSSDEEAQRSELIAYIVCELANEKLPFIEAWSGFQSRKPFAIVHLNPDLG